MEAIVEFISALTRPLDIYIIIAAIIAGLVLGGVYNRSLGLPAIYAFHKFVAGVAFLFFVAIMRFIEVGTLSAAGYLGVAILWGIFCLFSYIGTIIRIDVRRVKA